MDMIYTAVLEMILKGYEYILPIKKKIKVLVRAGFFCGLWGRICSIHTPSFWCIAGDPWLMETSPEFLSLSSPSVLPVFLSVQISHF